MPSVSIVIPAYNAAPFVAEALQSVSRQTYVDWNAIVVDDGSQDATADVVRRQKDPRIHLIQQENRGVSAARNRGMEESDSPWIAFLDADDIWLPQKLQSQLQTAEQEQADAVFGPVNLLGDGKPRSYPSQRYLLEGNDGLRRMLSRNHVPLSTMVVRRQVVDRAGRFDESISGVEDYDLWLRMLLVGARIWYDPEATAIYRLHAGSLSHSLPRIRRGMRDVLRKRRMPRMWLNLRRHLKIGELFVSECRHRLAERRARSLS